MINIEMIILLQYRGETGHDLVVCPIAGEKQRRLQILVIRDMTDKGDKSTYSVFSEFRVLIQTHIVSKMMEWNHGSEQATG
jgi:hypothetical protein